MPEGRLGELNPLVFGLTLLKKFYRYTPEVQIKDHLFRLAGTRQIETYLKTGSSDSLKAYWKEEVADFKQRRKPYLLY